MPYNLCLQYGAFEYWCQWEHFKPKSHRINAKEKQTCTCKLKLFPEEITEIKRKAASQESKIHRVWQHISTLETPTKGESRQPLVGKSAKDMDNS